MGRMGPWVTSSVTKCTHTSSGSFICVKWVTQCLPLCDPLDCSPAGSSVHGISQARILEWIAISFSRGSSRPRNQTHVSCITGGSFMDWAIREAQQELIWPQLEAECLHSVQLWWGGRGRDGPPPFMGSLSSNVWRPFIVHICTRNIRAALIASLGE